MTGTSAQGANRVPKLVAFNEGSAVVPRKRPFTRVEGFGGTAVAWFLGLIQKNPHFEVKTCSIFEGKNWNVQGDQTN